MKHKNNKINETSKTKKHIIILTKINQSVKTQISMVKNSSLPSAIPLTGLPSTPFQLPWWAYIRQQGAGPHTLGARQAVTGIDVDQTQVAILRVAWQLRD